MKTIDITKQLNKAEKAIIEIVEKAHKNETEQLDLMDYIAFCKKEFIKLRKETKDLVCFSEPIDY